MNDQPTPSACVDCGATICEHALRRLTGAQIVVNDPTPAPDAQRLSAGIEIGELIDDLKREHGFSDEAWKMFADAVAESHQAEFDNDRLRAENTAMLDRATRAEQALAEAHKALAEISAGAIETLDFADRLYTSGRTGDDVLVEFETSAPAWRIREIKTLLAAAAASTLAGATEPPAADSYEPTAPTVEFPDAASAIAWLQTDEDEPAPDEGAQGRYPGAHHEPNNPSCGCPGAVCTARRLTVIHDPAVSEMVSAYLDEPAPDEGARGKE